MSADLQPGWFQSRGTDVSCPWFIRTDCGHPTTFGGGVLSRAGNKLRRAHLHQGQHGILKGSMDHQLLCAQERGSREPRADHAARSCLQDLPWSQGVGCFPCRALKN